MTDYGTIKIPADAYQRHNERRQELKLTWEQYIDGQAPNQPEPPEIDYAEIEARCRNAVEEVIIHE